MTKLNQEERDYLQIEIRGTYQNISVSRTLIDWMKNSNKERLNLFCDNNFDTFLDFELKDRYDN